ncbi:MAG TPA: amidohydrolase [Alphaproteobacteria bacterium]|nr:amidohydrolase [Alphaproteobacteria bacterium]
MRTPDKLCAGVERHLVANEAALIGWRRDFHQHPELGNRETRTSGIVAAHLEGLGLKVRTGIAHTGIVAVLDGGRPGPVVGLRADMDALPVSEEVDVPFRSRARATYNGEHVGVMHACGHDGHTAMLMAVADALANHRDELPGKVKFIFQPAEEGAPKGEEGGAALMIKEGVLADPKPDAMLAIHIVSRWPSDRLVYFKGPMLASADMFEIKVRGRQAHGAMPWAGIDPVVSAAQVVLGIQTIVSRQVNVSQQPSVVSVSVIKGGIRHNIIPDAVELGGTIRTFDEDMRKDIHARIKRTAEMIAAASGAQAEVNVITQYPVTMSNGELVDRLKHALERVAGPQNVTHSHKLMAADDYAFFAHHIPATTYFNVGCTPPDQDHTTAEPNHSPRFYVDEKCLLLGARAMAMSTLEFLHGA